MRRRLATLIFAPAFLLSLALGTGSARARAAAPVVAPAPAAVDAPAPADKPAPPKAKAVSVEDPDDGKDDEADDDEDQPAKSTKVASRDAASDGAEDADAEAAAPAAGRDPASDAPIEGDPDASPSPTATRLRRRLRKPAAVDYKRSRLTSDESEGVADRRTMLLTTGEDKTVDLDFEANATVNGISIGNPVVVATTLVRVGDHKQQLVFKPLKAGETTVTVRATDGSIRLIFLVRVTGSNLLRIASEIRDLLRDVEGVEIRIVGPKIIIEGEVLVPQDYGRIYMVTTDKAYQDFVMNLSTLSPLALQVIAKKIQDDIHIFAPNVTTRVANGVIFLEGTVDAAYKATRASEVAAVYLYDVKPLTLAERDPTAHYYQNRRPIQNLIIVEPPPPKKQDKLVRITVHFVQLSKDYQKLFGFSWEPGFTPGSDQLSIGSNNANGTSTPSSGLTFTATLSNLFPKLASAQSAGFARVLRTGTIVVRSGQAAQLNDTTDYPFVVQGANGQVTPTTANVGLSIGVTPQILGQSEDIQMDLKLTQSSVVGRVTNGTAPVTAKHEVTTKLYVKSNESAAVAAVNSTDIGTDFNKDDPGQGSFGGATGGTATTTLPIFTLLHSKNYRKAKSQFVIFVTPQITENASDGTDDLKKNFRVRVK